MSKKVYSFEFFWTSRKLYSSSKRKEDNMWQTLRLQSHLKAKKYISFENHIHLLRLRQNFEKVTL